MLTILKKVKGAGQDFEWYPTTPKIIDTVRANLRGQGAMSSLLDIGAGDGRVLKAIADDWEGDIDRSDYYGAKPSNMDLFAIEKSTILMGVIPEDVSIIGTDFLHQSLMDKKVDVIFCNPPYSQFEDWTVKIIREANSSLIYMVIPSRWNARVAIHDAIKAREAKCAVLGKFDFSNAVRKARAKVEILVIDLRNQASRNWRSSTISVDPFDLWINDHFQIKPLEEPEEGGGKSTIKERANASLVLGGNLVETLEELYQSEMGHLLNNYQAVCQLDPVILKELGVDVSSVNKGIKMKIEGLKATFWQILFGHLDAITSRLTVKSRKDMVQKLGAKTNIDFNASNVYATTIWAVRNANLYFKAQTIALFYVMSEKACVRNYKSNKKLWDDGVWRYGKDAGHDRYSLEYRMVLAHIGGIYRGSYSFESKFGLSESAYDFLEDTCTIANNLGFPSSTRPRSFEWEGGKKYVFLLLSGKPLMEVRAYKNGNLHIKFDQKFILSLNLEVGRLLGWLQSAKQASQEMDCKEEDAQKLFQSSFVFAPGHEAGLLEYHPQDSEV